MQKMILSLLIDNIIDPIKMQIKEVKMENCNKLKKEEKMARFMAWINTNLITKMKFR